MSISFCSSSCSSSRRRILDRHALLLRAALEQARHHVLDVELDLFDVRAGDDLERREVLLLDFDLDEPVVEAALAQLLAHALARALCFFLDLRRILVGRRKRPRQQQVEQPLLGVLLRLGAHVSGVLLAHHADGDLDEIANHRLDVAADVTDFGELRRLDLQEGRLRELGEPARNLGLADSGRPDHEDVLRRDFFRHLRRQLLPPHAVPQRDGHRTLGLLLTDDVFVELGDDLARGECVDAGVRPFWKLNHW